MASILYQSLQTGLEEQDMYAADAAYAAAAAAGLNSADESLPYSTSELNAPEYSTDDFRMFQFKVARCSKRYVHDWRACPFAHPTENARRRDPRLVKYLPVPCPDYKRGICLRGDSCTYSHGVYECWLHPAKYRTQLCKEGPNCRRPVCFFAHSVLDLRQPCHFNAGAGAPTPVPAPEDVQASVAAAVLAQRQAASAATVTATAVTGRLSSDASFNRLSSDEVLNNIQGQESRSPSDMAQLSTPLLLASSTSSRPSSTSPTRRSSSSTCPAGSTPRSPERSCSPTSPPQASLLADQPASDAAAAMAVLAQQQQAQAKAAAAQAAAALAQLSMDGRASLDASSATAAAATTTQAMLHASAGTTLPPRMSLDSLLATRQQQAAAGWAPGGGVPAPPTAAAALAAGASSLPLNEQPFPSGNAPRMSNAVARKLGLAPQRTSLDARLTKLRGGTPAPRSSIDGILHALQQTSVRSSLDQQQAAMLQAMNHTQLQAMAGLNGGAGQMPPQMNGYGTAHPGYTHSPAAYAMASTRTAIPVPNGSMALHPALLSLVAAQMAPQQMPNGMPAMPPPPGVPNGMHSGLGTQHGRDANMAALVDSLSSWQLNGGGSPNCMAHGSSMEGVSGMARAPSMHSVRPGTYYEPKGIWGSQEVINNQAGAES